MTSGELYTPRRTSGGPGAPGLPVTDVVPDPADFRDVMYRSSLVEVPDRLPPDGFRLRGVPVLDQGKEGACTGFALATVANYLLRGHGRGDDPVSVSPRMLYEMAKRYDEWEGEEYEGSSCRGAIKGWHKHGVCREETWPIEDRDRSLTPRRRRDALDQPLGAYYRVDHRDLDAMHAALAEVGVLLASARVHDGWGDVPATGEIPFQGRPQGGHAFAIVGYDRFGFWIQNSWGARWGATGFGRICYPDWLQNAMDVWVARLGAPVEIGAPDTAIVRGAAGDGAIEIRDRVAEHFLAIERDGRLSGRGRLGTTADSLRELIRGFEPGSLDGGPRRLLLYAPGGMVREDEALRRLEPLLRVCLPAGIQPLALSWLTGLEPLLLGLLEEARRSRVMRVAGNPDSVGLQESRVDDALEPLVRDVGGKLLWEEVKDKAERTRMVGKACDVLAEVIRDRQLDTWGRELELHLLGHGAGALILPHLVRSLTVGHPVGEPRIRTCTLWAPALGLAEFGKTLGAACEAGIIRDLRTLVLDEAVEDGDSFGGGYGRSFLRLVSGALERSVRVPGIREGEPLLGLARDLRDAECALQFVPGFSWGRTPGSGSGASRHSGFDLDPGSLEGVVRRVLGEPTDP